jgi:hypothetical protein
MITLTGRQTIASCDVFLDDVDPLTRYVMPQGPRIALDEKGDPIFSLVWYRRPVDKLTPDERKTRLGGGILTLSTELKPTPDQETEIRKQVAGDPGLHAQLESIPESGPDLRNWWENEIHRDPEKLASALKLSAVPIVDGTVTISVLGETPAAGAAPGEFVANLVGVGRVSMTGTERASFMAKLTQDGAVLLWDMLEKDLKAIRVEYDLTFDYRLDGVRLVVWCDAEKAYHSLQQQWQRLQDDASFSETHSNGDTSLTFSHDQANSAGSTLWSVASNSESSRVEVIPEAGPTVVTPEMIAELMKTGQEMVTQFLANAFLDYKGGQADTPLPDQPPLQTQLADYEGRPYGHHGISEYTLKQVDTSAQANLDVQLKTKSVIEGHMTPNDNISNIATGHKLDTLRTQIEIDAAWYQYLNVQVACTADFDRDPVNLVTAHLAYNASGSQGTIHSAKDVEFQKGSAPQSFATYLAAPDKRQYDYAYKVYYHGTTNTWETSGKTDQEILVLNTDSLGILRVEVQAGVIDWSNITTVIVKLSYGSGAAQQETELTLTQSTQQATWTAVIAAPITGPYTYQCTFVDKTGQRIAGDLQTSRGASLVVDQPLQEALEVTLVAAGSFGADGLLSHVVVALRYQDDAHNYSKQDVVTLSNDGDSSVWNVPLINKDLRTYQYKVTVFYSDGVTREDTWQTTDQTVLPVGDPYGMRVQILPYLLKNPPNAWQFGTVHLAFDDAPAQIHAEKDFEVTDFGTPLIWRFRLGAPTRHTYRYQLTLFRQDGQEVKLPEAEADKEVLVLEPPR